MSLEDGNKTVDRGAQIEYLMAHLLDYFRDPKMESRFTQAAKIALNQVSLSLGNASPLERRFLYYAGKLKNNISPQSLRYFAEECLSSCAHMGDEEVKQPSLSLKALRKKAHTDLSLSLAAGHSQEAAIQRAANELIKKKNQSEQTDRVHKMANSHPLKDVLLACNIGQRHLAKEDIKQHFLRLTRNPTPEKNGVLFGLLQKAQAFSVPRLHRLLGDDLFFLCRPLGFMDSQQSIIIVEVPTNAHLHALTYRKLDILRGLRKDAAFRSVRTIRFKVTHTMF